MLSLSDRAEPCVCGCPYRDDGDDKGHTSDGECLGCDSCIGYWPESDPVNRDPTRYTEHRKNGAGWLQK